MSKKLPIAYAALLLTAGDLLLRFFSTAFQVYLSSAIGAAGIGLLHLILSVAGLALTVGAAGIRTASMYLTAEEIGREHPGGICWIISGCFFYALVCSGLVAAAAYAAAPAIAGKWLGESGAASALRIFCAFIPVLCMTSVMTGCFVASNRVAALALVELIQQIASMGITVLLLLTVPKGDAAQACQAVIFGDCIGSVLTLLCLFVLYRIKLPRPAPREPVGQRILSAAAPLALADDLRAGISSLEHLMVPRRLALYPRSTDPLASFGMVAGMVFPVMMFPAAILFSLVDLLIPELARCSASEDRGRIHHLAKRSLRLTLLYGLLCGGGLFLCAGELCSHLFPHASVGSSLQGYALLVPMLYCDIVIDGITKGLGQQRACVRYNILSNTMDVILLFFLLPRWGMTGYFISFALTHAVNFLLSLRRLLRLGTLSPHWYYPCFALSCCLIAAWCAGFFTGAVRRMAAFCGLFFCLCYFCGVITREDIQWAKSLFSPGKHIPCR